MADYSMVQECVDHYSVQEAPDGSVEIRIRAPARFAQLWMVKLSELRASDEETGTADQSGSSSRG